MTLIELLIAISVMTVIAGALGAMARAVQLSVEYSEGQGTATQHARVALERIATAVSGATAADDWPGVFVLHTQQGSWRYPHTLVVWRPSGAPVNPAGPPRLDELVIFCTDPANPNKLIEVTAPGDARLLASTSAAMQTQIEPLKTSAATRKVVLTELVRVGSVGGSGQGARQGAVRFEVELSPSAAEWASYKSDPSKWNTLAWPQGICGSTTGLRQVWVRTELQLIPGEGWRLGDPAGERAIPFLGSAACYYEMHR